jgi:hypothetical protein
MCKDLLIEIFFPIKSNALREEGGLFYFTFSMIVQIPSESKGSCFFFFKETSLESITVGILLVMQL